MRKFALALAATAALGIAAPNDAKAWGYRYGGWGGVGAGLAIGALAGGLIAASTARAYAYPAYGYGGYYPELGALRRVRRASRGGLQRVRHPPWLWQPVLTGANLRVHRGAQIGRRRRIPRSREPDIRIPRDG